MIIPIVISFLVGAIGAGASVLVFHSKISAILSRVEAKLSDIQAAVKK